MKLTLTAAVAALLMMPAVASAESPGGMTVIPANKTEIAQSGGRMTTCYTRVYRRCVSFASLPGRNLRVYCMRKARRQCAGVVRRG